MSYERWVPATSRPMIRGSHTAHTVRLSHDRGYVNADCAESILILEYSNNKRKIIFKNENRLK